MNIEHGVLTLSGYGIDVRVDRGHLLLNDGIGTRRSQVRLPRAGHGLKRLVVVGSDGMVSLGALRWLADQDAAFVMLDRDGSVLATTGPVRSSDARLRRAQALAIRSGTALEIARELIARKVDGQAKVVREKLLDNSTAEIILQFRASLANAEDASAIRLLESQAGRAYWSQWRNLSINFPKGDLRRVPDHWRRFGSRISILTGSPRLAVNPPNAILNYLYAVLEAEARLAATALGLDPGLGVLHADDHVRDSLACDLMEPVRPKVDAYVLDYILHETFEQRDGNCRLMAPFVERLSQTAPTWRSAVAPFAEFVARRLSSTIAKSNHYIGPATRLTQTNKRRARGIVADVKIAEPPRPETVCEGCGKPISRERKHCAECAIAVSRQNLVDIARYGRIAAQSAGARQRRAETQRKHEAGKRNWSPATLPDWLNNETYAQKIQPRLLALTNGTIASALGVSMAYAADIRVGRRRPHARHWQKLAEIGGN
jgi:CRISPR-associated endonuclease Cas1